MWKTFEEIKNHEPTIDRKHPLWRIKTEYKILLSSNLPILTNTFHFQLLTFFFQSTLGVHIKFNLGFFLNSHKKNICFYTNPNRFKIEIWMNEESSHSFSRKSIKNFGWKLEWNFLEKQATSKREGNEEHKNDCYSLSVSIDLSLLK